ncbi:hypothetical protein L3Y34_000392 [Caenorhabditis briggsae]|uniref:Uncharacterized protein n=1 Tax=Caenorhabditis briggsae TaxID=6238 RepID=A0AAE9D9A8_CAEBR|nr:hypothetical protein L3Y34_000392 [Caenorhabditis briggsae]
MDGRRACDRSSSGWKKGFRQNRFVDTRRCGHHFYFIGHKNDRGPIGSATATRKSAKKLRIRQHKISGRTIESTRKEGVASGEGETQTEDVEETTETERAGFDQRRREEELAKVQYEGKCKGTQGTQEGYGIRVGTGWKFHWRQEGYCSLVEELAVLF